MWDCGTLVLPLTALTITTVTPSIKFIVLCNRQSMMISSYHINDLFSNEVLNLPRCINIFELLMSALTFSSFAPRVKRAVVFECKGVKISALNLNDSLILKRGQLDWNVFSLGLPLLALVSSFLKTID